MTYTIKFVKFHVGSSVSKKSTLHSQCSMVATLRPCWLLFTKVHLRYAAQSPKRCR